MSHAEKIIRVNQDISWLPKPNECEIVLATDLPPLELVNTAIAVAFVEDRLLMTNLVKRGWDLPGGHVEPGEHPDETVLREVYEETGANLESAHLFAFQRLRLLGPKPPAYGYPYPVSYQIFYWARVKSLDDFPPTPEAQGRDLFSPATARSLPWVQRNMDLYELALQMATQTIS